MSGPVTLINSFTPRPGGIDELERLQRAETLRLGPDSATHGWRGNAIYRSADGERLVIVTHFADADAVKTWQQTDAFRDHLERLDPVLQKVDSTEVVPVVVNPAPDARLRLAVITGSTREGRFSPVAADWIADRAQAHGAYDVTRIDLRDHPLPFFGDPAASPAQKQAARDFAAATAGFDAYVLTAAEYNHAPTAVLKNALDHADWARKPVGYVAYGGAGGARATEHLRAIAAEMRMVAARDAVHIGFADLRAMQSDRRTPADFPHLERTGAAMLDDLAWWARALRVAATPVG